MILERSRGRGKGISTTSPIFAAGPLIAVGSLPEEVVVVLEVQP
jgi:hypothetical protein